MGKRQSAAGWGDSSCADVQTSRAPSPPVLRLLVGLWAAASILLVTWGAVHQLGAGDLPPSDSSAWQSTPGTWPWLVRGEPNVIMFVHPQCPCSIASVDALCLAIEEFQTAVTIVAYRPEHADSEWGNSELLRRIRNETALQVRWDDGGGVAEQFGISTSGTCILLDSNLDVRFTGGLTAGRGHQGWNEGMERFRSQLAAVRDNQRTSPVTYPVFGCPLSDRH